MTKKVLDQSTMFKQDLINTVEKDFIFSDNPINRYEISQNNSSQDVLNKAERLSALKTQINAIENCNLKNNSNNLILGEGNVNSPIMLIGESPGEEEEKSGLAFQGEVRKLLKKMLIAINVKLENVYLSYSINFRPPEDRKPSAQEIKRYSKFIKEHISIINPKILVLMGSTAMEAVIGSSNKISNERGEWKEIILKNKTYPIMVTFSPSYLIRFPENKKYSWKDLKKIRQKIHDLNISFT